MLELRGWKPHRRLSYSYNTTDLRMDDPPYIGYFDLFFLLSGKKSVKAGMPKLIGRLVGNLTQALKPPCKGLVNHVRYVSLNTVSIVWLFQGR